jgi:uncharacterized protein with von Willebrand factor type A (vWA) domain
MDVHVKTCEELFSASRTEFKHLEYFYFHNFIYEQLWQDNSRRHADLTATWDVLHKYGGDYKVIFVGDASMSPYEILYPGGSVEHWNDEPGSLWMQRFRATYEKVIWLNPTPPDRWNYTQSISMVQELLEDRMFPLTLEGLEAGMKYLTS